MKAGAPMPGEEIPHPLSMLREAFPEMVFALCITPATHTITVIAAARDGEPLLTRCGTVILARCRATYPARVNWVVALTCRFAAQDERATAEQLRWASFFYRDDVLDNPSFYALYLRNPDVLGRVMEAAQETRGARYPLPTRASRPPPPRLR